MNKKEFVERVSESTETTKKDTEKIVNAVFEEIAKALEEKDNVQIIGFGTFEARFRQERNGVNPSTGEELVIPERYVPAFKPGKKLKERVAE